MKLSSNRKKWKSRPKHRSVAENRKRAEWFQKRLQEQRAKREQRVSKPSDPGSTLEMPVNVMESFQDASTTDSGTDGHQEKGKQVTLPMPRAKPARTYDEALRREYESRRGARKV